MKRTKHRPAQIEIHKFAVKRLRCLVFANPGIGKTFSALSLILDTLENQPGFKTLVFGTPMLLDTWVKEARKHPQFRKLRMIALVGTPAQRLKLLNGPGDVYLISYNNAPWLHKVLPDWSCFGFLVLDEITKVKSFRLKGGGKQAKAIGYHAHEIKYFLGLTGTPTASGFLGLWGICWFVDRGKALGRTYKSFTDKYCEEVSPLYSNFKAYRVIEDHEEEITEKISSYSLSLDMDKYYPDLDQTIDIDIEIELPPSARAIYDHLEEELFADLASGKVVAQNIGVAIGRCLQCASGSLYLTHKKCNTEIVRNGKVLLADGSYAGSMRNRPVEVIHDAKLDALEHIYEELNGANLLVVVHFVSDMKRIKERFPQAVSIKEEDAIDRWNRGEIPMLLLNAMSAGHGLNLQDGGHHVCFYTQWWSAEQNQQVLERIGPMRQLQSGYDRRVYVYRLIAKDTVDDVVHHKIKYNLDAETAFLYAITTLNKE